jgi:hypothetical protein
MVAGGKLFCRSAGVSPAPDAVENPIRAGETPALRRKSLPLQPSRFSPSLNYFEGGPFDDGGFVLCIVVRNDYLQRITSGLKR